MSLLLMAPFCFQTSRDGVNRDIGEALPRLPGETRITGKEPVKLGFLYIDERSGRTKWLQSH